MEILLIMLIDYSPWGNALFGTAPIPLAVWMFILPFACGMIVLELLRRRVWRGISRNVR
jgi:sodium/potassium-transporting ATPase subunit alpha